MLDRDKDAADKDENLPRKDNASVISCAFQKLGRHAIDGQERDEFLHPNECRNHENQQCKPEGVEHVAEELPARLLVTCDFVARENRNEDNRQKSGADHVIQDVWNHEGEVKGVFFKRHAGGVGEEHFTENPEYAAQEHRNGNNNSGFIHVDRKFIYFLS